MHSPPFCAFLTTDLSSFARGNAPVYVTLYDERGAVRESIQVNNLDGFRGEGLLGGIHLASSPSGALALYIRTGQEYSLAVYDSIGVLAGQITAPYKDNDLTALVFDHNDQLLTFRWTAYGNSPRWALDRYEVSNGNLRLSDSVEWPYRSRLGTFARYGEEVYAVLQPADQPFRYGPLDEVTGTVTPVDEVEGILGGLAVDYRDLSLTAQGVALPLSDGGGSFVATKLLTSVGTVSTQDPEFRGGTRIEVRNPVRDRIEIRLTGSSIAEQDWSLHDLNGRQLSKPEVQQVSNGHYTAVWPARLSTGMYVVRAGTRTAFVLKLP